MTRFVDHFACLSRKCGSSDALAVSEDSEGIYFGHCFSCGENFHHNWLAREIPELGIDVINWENKNYGELYEDMGEKITQEQRKWVEENTQLEGNNFRGISDETLKHFQFRTEYEDGKPIKRYYPSTEEGKLVGYKVRIVKDKDFYPVGKVGKICDFVGQFRDKVPKRTILLCGGEEDAAAAYDMLSKISPKNVDGSSKWNLPTVLSPLTGEACKGQIQQHYEYFEKAEKIILCLDNDAAGEKAMQEIAQILPDGKVFIMDQPTKDPNEALMSGKQREWVDCYWRHRQYDPLGIKNSVGIMDSIREHLKTPRLTLPPYMRVMQERMGGGVLDAVIMNIIADTSVGKSSHVNNMVYHWIFNAPEPITIASLEATEGQWGTDMLSLHLGKNLTWMSDEEREEFLSKPEIEAKCKELFEKEDGSPRFYIIDERDGNIDKLEKQLERAFKQYDSKIFIIDVLTDILRGMDKDKQEDHMRWQKFFIKKGVRLINVLHTRKPPKSKDGSIAPISEYDAYGSSSFVQSAAINILLERDKESEDDVERNTTYVRMPKCRGGITGECGEWYYDWKTRQVHDKGEYFSDEKTIVQTEDGYEVVM